MSIEEIVAALQAIIDGAGDQPLTDEQAERYEALERDLAVAKRNVEIRSRQNAYTTVQGSNLYVGVAKKDNTLDRAWDHYLRTGKENADLAEYRAQSLSDSAGGYMVPSSTFYDRLVEVQKAFGGVANEATTITTSTGQPLEFPSLDDTANSGSITAEASAFADGADLAFGTVTLGAFKYTSQGTGTNTPLRVSYELLQDSQFDVASLVARKLGERIARKQASDFCVGTGTTLPFGVCHANLSPNETADAPPVIDYDDLLDTEGQLDPSYYANAKWVMHTQTWIGIRGLLDNNTTGRPLIFDQAASGISSQPRKLLLGYEVVLDNSMPLASGGAGRNCVVFGDIREGYLIRRVAGLTVVANPYSRAENGQIEYTAWERADANIANRSAYVVLKA